MHRACVDIVMYVYALVSTMVGRSRTQNKSHGLPTAERWMRWCALAVHQNHTSASLAHSIALAMLWSIVSIFFISCSQLNTSLGYGCAQWIQTTMYLMRAIRDSCEAHIINMPIHVLVDDGVMTVLYIIRYTRVGCPRTSKSRLTILRSPIQKA
jgi:hypothetical protein